MPRTAQEDTGLNQNQMPLVEAFRKSKAKEEIQKYAWNHETGPAPFPKVRADAECFARLVYKWLEDNDYYISAGGVVGKGAMVNIQGAENMVCESLQEEEEVLMPDGTRVPLEQVDVKDNGTSG